MNARAVAFALLCSGCAAFADGSRDVRVMPKGSSRGSPVSQVELQQDVQRFTSDFLSHLGEAGERVYQESGPKQRELALRRILVYASNALDIGTGPFPEINLADMLVFVTLSRYAYEQYWLPDVFGDEGRPIADAFAEAERRVWDLSGKILSGQQQAQFHELIAQWQRAHPRRHSVEGVRFYEFSSRAGAVTEERAARARGLFGEIKAATQTADQAVLIAERAMFLAQRMPFLIRAHARLSLQENLSDSLDRLSELDAGALTEHVPAMQSALTDLVAISHNAAEAARDTRELVESSKRHPIFGQDRAGDAPDERSGVRGVEDDEDSLSLREALTRIEAISERSLALVRELRAMMPEDPAATLAYAERSADSLARRFAAYALLVGVGWAAAFWGGYYLVKQRPRRRLRP